MFKKISDCDSYYLEYSVDDMPIEEIVIRDYRGSESVFESIKINTHIVILRDINPRSPFFIREYNYITLYSFNSNGCDRTYKRINYNIEGILLDSNEGLDIDDSLIMKFIEEYLNR